MAATMKGPLRRFVVDLSLDAHSFSFLNTPEGTHQARLEFLLVAYDSEGNRANYLDRSLTANLSTKQYGDAMTSGLHARIAFDVPAAQTVLRVAVQDLNAGRVGSLEVPLGAAK
jgi:hypothetical protein